jgi:hypothetical protein
MLRDVTKGAGTPGTAHTRTEQLPRVVSTYLHFNSPLLLSKIALYYSLIQLRIFTSIKTNNQHESNIKITSVRNKVFLVLGFIVHLSHYMFPPLSAAILRLFANTKNI